MWEMHLEVFTDEMLKQKKSGDDAVTQTWWWKNHIFFSSLMACLAISSEEGKSFRLLFFHGEFKQVT